ncbi:hypothetical protein OUZ56_015938 [Daphnia magna]|uniref:Uncharacterized protein n=1 Tax=Daphnia magna TaxID=35525 RepID=A0ABR0AP79_9CRUS|nr:hypothetical protein OUZ56_015938 [Daphnia magna]
MFISIGSNKDGHHSMSEKKVVFGGGLNIIEEPGSLESRLGTSVTAERALRDSLRRMETENEMR